MLKKNMTIMVNYYKWSPSHSKWKHWEWELEILARVFALLTREHFGLKSCISSDGPIDRNTIPGYTPIARYMFAVNYIPL